MTTINSILSDINELSDNEKEILLTAIEEVLIFGSYSFEIESDVKEQRFNKGEVCPHCGKHNICKYGKPQGKQRYFCNSCNKTFSDFTYSPIYNSKKPLKKWILYAKCMISGYSIRKSAEIVGIDPSTSFYWRHKILDAIRAFLGIGHLEGIIEADETFFRESFKGNHSKSLNFKMPRESHKRATPASKRGISDEQICVSTAIDRQGNIIAELLCHGRVSSDDLNRLYEGHISDESIFCTDSLSSYIKLAKDLNLEHHRIKKGKHKEGIYHIQHVNSMHSELKQWMQPFKGVSTKYLSNYIHWFKWLQLLKNERDIIKVKDLLLHSSIVHTTTKTSDFRNRKAIFI
jgi:transposase-like protein